MSTAIGPTREKVAAVIDRDRAGVVSVRGADNDRFVIAMAEAAQVLERHQRRKDEVMDVVRAVSGSVWDWCNSHRDRVRLAYVSFRATHWAVWAISTSESYDEQLAEPLHELRITLHDSLADLPMEVRQLPGADDWALEDFIDFGKSVLIYGEAPRTPEAR